jgi:hypothetical protein
MELISLTNDLQPLVDYFNARPGLIRVLAFVSPT